MRQASSIGFGSSIIVSLVEAPFVHRCLTAILIGVITTVISELVKLKIERMRK
jgi:hypothetical protein